MRPLRWAFDCSNWRPSKEDFIKSMACIQSEERERVLQFVFRQHVRPALIGRLMLRAAVNHTFHLKNQEISFGRSDKGKPILNDNKSTFDINISHHGRLVVLASHSAEKVGVDVMQIEQRDNLDSYFDTMKRVFSPQEWVFIREGSSFDSDFSCQGKMRRFLRLWSLKESYFKAEGMGITTDLRSIEFNCKSNVVSGGMVSDTEILVEGRVLADCRFDESIVEGDHCVAVCVINDMNMDFKKDLLFETLSSEKLLSLTSLTEESQLQDVWTNYCSKQESPGFFSN